MYMAQVYLRDLVDKVIDNRGKNPKYSLSGIDVIETGCISGKGKYPDYSLVKKYVDDYTYNNWFRSGHPYNGDLLIITVGNNVGAVALMDRNIGCITQNLIGLKFKDNVCSDFIYYYLSQKVVFNYFQGLNIGSAQPSIKVPHLLNFELIIPNFLVQKQIAKILSDLDDKIHLNNQINQTLEAIAQAIFKSWFIDFEPVRAKIAAKQEGKDPERAAMCAISGKSKTELEQMVADDFAELQATAALFPDELVESELGEVPRGWEVATIGKRFNVVMGQSPKGDTYNGNKHGKLFFQGRAEFGWRYPTPRLYTTDPKRVAKENDILMSVRAPVGDMNVAMEECCIGRGLSALSHRSGSFSYSYYCLKALQSKFNVFNGEGTVFGSINQNDLKNISFIEPINELIDLFAKTINKYDQRIKLNSFNTKSLIDVRDTLLPKLLSGELDVSGLQGEGA